MPTGVVRMWGAGERYPRAADFIGKLLIFHCANLSMALITMAALTWMNG